jgi:hypothetical protein
MNEARFSLPSGSTRLSIPNVADARGEFASLVFRIRRHSHTSSASLQAAARIALHSRPFDAMGHLTQYDTGSAMKYALTTIVALLFGTAGYRLTELLRWKRWQERLFVFLAATFAAARLCAGAWM